MIRAVAFLLVSAAVFAFAVLWAAAHLPVDGVAVHVDVHGEVNRYASRAEALRWFTSIGVVLGGLAVTCLAAVRLLPVRLVNIPHKEYWIEPRRVPRLRSMLSWDIAVVFSLPLLGMSYLPVEVTLLTRDPAGHNQAWLPIVGGVTMLALFGHIAWMVVGRYRPGRDAR